LQIKYFSIQPKLRYEGSIICWKTQDKFSFGFSTDFIKVLIDYANLGNSFAHKKRYLFSFDLKQKK